MKNGVMEPKAELMLRHESKVGSTNYSAFILVGMSLAKARVLYLILSTVRFPASREEPVM